MLFRSAYYLIGIPFGIWLAFSCHLGLHGLWYGITVSLVYCALCTTYMCIRTDWHREVQKVVERMKRDLGERR